MAMNLVKSTRIFPLKNRFQSDVRIIKKGYQARAVSGLDALVLPIDAVSTHP
jgi:hypothetical protein